MKSLISYWCLPLDGRCSPLHPDQYIWTSFLWPWQTDPRQCGHEACPSRSLNTAGLSGEPSIHTTVWAEKIISVVLECSLSVQVCGMNPCIVLRVKKRTWTIFYSREKQWCLSKCSFCEVGNPRYSHRLWWMIGCFFITNRLKVPLSCLF